MPMFFADVYRQAQGVEPEDPNNADLNRKLTAAEFAELERFKAVIITDCCMEPRIKLKAEEAGDVLLSDVPDDVREFIYLYSQRLVNFPTSPNPEKDVEKDEVTAATLKPFLHNRARSKKSAAVDTRRPAVRQKTQRNARR